MPAETPSPSPLTPEERADLEGISALWSGLPDGGLGYITSESSRALGRLLSEVDRLAARVSDLEAERDGLRDALEVALALCPPAPEDKKESGREPGHPAYGWPPE